MFKKLISNISFSPALVGQLGFYAKRLKKEEATRRLGLIFTALALVVQFFAVFSPPQAANASSPDNFIPGGVTSRAQYLQNYDANTNHIRDLYTLLGITRQDIVNTYLGQINSKDIPYSWGMRSPFSAAQGDRTYTIRTSDGGLQTYHYQPLWLWDSGNNLRTGSYYDAYIGHTASGMWFALMKLCGNLNLKVPPPTLHCPSGMIGNYPNCTTPRCPSGTTGTYPNCKDLDCPSGTIGTYPNCKAPPTATCTALGIERISGGYQFNSEADAQHGATITGYVYTVQKDGKTILDKTVNSSSLTNSYNYSQTTQGTYTVTLTVKTSLGNKTSSNCVKTFNITAPAVCNVNPQLPASSPECQPCPGDSTLWVKNSQCSAQIVDTKAAVNITQGNVDATKTTANGGDEITYTLNVVNRGLAPSSVTVSDAIPYVLQYATLSDNGGGTLDNQTQTIAWPSTTINPGQTISRMFTVKVISPVPAIGQGTGDLTSYNCVMNNTFGNNVSIPVNCPAPKAVEQVVNQLPHTGPGENMLFAGVVFSIVAYFYARSRQMGTEVRLVRRDLNTGTI